MRLCIRPLFWFATRLLAYFYIEDQARVSKQNVIRLETNILHDMSRVMRKPAFCICENKVADQLRGIREADQRLCFRYIDSTIPPLSKSEISSL